jgi:uncharacterized protein (DUF4415 family)
MKRDKRFLPEISDIEEAAIQAGISRDADNPELSDEQLASMRPAKHVLPPALYEALVKRGRGRPRSNPATKKVIVKLRVDPDVLEAFKAAGPGWQTRMSDALKQAACLRPAEPEILSVRITSRVLSVSPATTVPPIFANSRVLGEKIVLH